jgi:hypothetical protein
MKIFHHLIPIIVEINQKVHRKIVIQTIVDLQINKLFFLINKNKFKKSQEFHPQFMITDNM